MLMDWLLASTAPFSSWQIHLSWLASVLMVPNGVAARLREDAPQLIDVHCMAHDYSWPFFRCKEGDKGIDD